MLCENCLSWTQSNAFMGHGLASSGYFCVKKNMPLEAATSQDVLVENRAGWRAGCHMSVFCKSLLGAPTALLQLKCPSAPRTTLCVSTSISQASDSLLYLRDISFYPLPPSVSPETCASLLFCHDGTVGLRGPWLLKTEARPVSSTSAFPGIVHATQQNMVKSCRMKQ